jgi:hypothetical protein
MGARKSMILSYVLFTPTIPHNGSLQALKDYLILLTGWTCMLTFVMVSYENDLLAKINEMKTVLISSPIDFCIGVKNPIQLLTK